MRTAASLIVCLLAASVSLLAACGGSSEPSTSGSPPVGAPPAATESAVPVVGVGVTRVNVSMAFLGSLQCSPSATYDRASHELSWEPCSGDAGAAPPSPRVLDTSEAAQVDAALKAITLRPAADQVCGGEDGLDYYLQTVDSTGKPTKYSAYDINCYGNKRVTGLSETYGLLDKLR